MFSENLSLNAFKEAFNLAEAKREGSCMVSSSLKDSEQKLELLNEFSHFGILL